MDHVSLDVSRFGRRQTDQSTIPVSPEDPRFWLLPPGLPVFEDFLPVFSVSFSNSILITKMVTIVKLQGFSDKRRRKKDNKICTKFLFDIQNGGNKLEQKTTSYRNLTLQIFGDSTITTSRNGNF